MPRQLDRSQIGGWLFKCNPKEWDIEAFFRDGRRIESWRVHKSYRLRLIQPSDPAVLWVTGSERRGPTPGIWAVGYTTGKIFDDSGDDYWINKTRGAEISLYAGLLMWPINVVPRSAVLADANTAKLEVLTRPQMSNPCYLTPEEQYAIKAFVPSWPTYS